ncbi:ferredoxin reductase [Naasia sp. SYSU D00057]|uniref:ferredoxin reductase n=1 Tax=Naasia sp. SYSU D00057 TaxID=2817380 RepID=UPI001B30D04C|nr:ferredoxin reductase [Naasia sp. SYSU D00057]
MSSSWVPATLVDAWRETPGSRTLVLDARLEPALAGQHLDIRLTADDGYTAQRSYSLGSPAGAERFQVTVDRLDQGEVSPYLVDGLQVGHQIEVRGPVGRWFVWEPTQTEPIQLLAGGSGIVPLMSMIRTRELAGGTAPMRLLYSVRAPGDRFYTDELDDLAARGRIDLQYVFTREVPEGWPARAGRITGALLHELTLPPEDGPTIYVCGPTGFVEAATKPLMQFGHEASRIKTERFGPTG